MTFMCLGLEMEFELLATIAPAEGTDAGCFWPSGQIRRSTHDGPVPERAPLALDERNSTGRPANVSVWPSDLLLWGRHGARNESQSPARPRARSDLQGSGRCLS